METNLSICTDIDTQLLDDAIKIGGLKTKNDTVNMALEEFIQKRKTADILTLFGTVEYDTDYDYKEARRQSQ